MAEIDSKGLLYHYFLECTPADLYFTFRSLPLFITAAVLTNNAHNPELLNTIREDK